MTQNTDGYLTIADIAEHLRVSRMTVYRLVESGKLVAHQIGRAYRIPESEYERYKRQLEAEATARALTASEAHADPIPGQTEISA